MRQLLQLVNAQPWLRPALMVATALCFVGLLFPETSLVEQTARVALPVLLSLGAGSVGPSYALPAPAASKETVPVTTLNAGVLVMPGTFKLPTIQLSFLTDPAFYTGILHGAQVAVEEASPDFTIAHRIAAAVGKALGEAGISTPDKAAEVPVGKAILDGLEAAGTQVATAVAEAQKL